MMNDHDAGEAAGGSAARSGQFSRDPMFDPVELFDVVERDENVHRVLAAMSEFRKRGDAGLFSRAVAVYVRSARVRGEPIEAVLGTLETVAGELERDGVPGFKQRDTPLRHLVLRGVLLAFYGAEVVRREADARRDRVERRSTVRGDHTAPGEGAR